MNVGEFAQPAAAVLRTAADHVEKVGLNQDGSYFAYDQRYLPQEERSCCVLGALNVVIQELDSYAITIYSAAFDALQDEVDSRDGATRGHVRITGWNDRPTTTKDDVVGALRGAADRLEA